MRSGTIVETRSSSTPTLPAERGQRVDIGGGECQRLRVHDAQRGARVLAGRGNRHRRETADRLAGACEAREHRMVLHDRHDQRLGGLGDLPQDVDIEHVLQADQRLAGPGAHVKGQPLLVGEAQVADAERHPEAPPDFHGGPLDHLLGIQRPD